MVFPIGDDNSDRRTTPYVNYVIIALNVLVFVVFQGLGANDQFTLEFSTVPAKITSGQNDLPDERRVIEDADGRKVELPKIPPTPVSVYLTLLTSMFMHASLAHIAGNMWFLWIFGDNVEDAIGHARYAVFYLLTGLIASLSHVLLNMSGPGSMIPSLGASGAISGVMGAYIVLYPTRRMRVILFRVLTVVPGYVAVGIWFLFQLVSSLGVLGGGGLAEGVAYAAHIGGFIAGAALIKPFTLGRALPPPPGVYRDERPPGPRHDF